jgi:hypothetical protein
MYVSRPRVSAAGFWMIIVRLSEMLNLLKSSITFQPRSVREALTSNRARAEVLGDAAGWVTVMIQTSSSGYVMWKTWHVRVRILLPFLLALVVAGCQRNSPHSAPNPGWLDSLIAQYEHDPAGPAPKSIYRYRVKGRVVYYFAARLPDQYSNLYDSSGRYLASPAGGPSRNGDGRSASFFRLRSDEQLVWQNSETR